STLASYTGSDFTSLVAYVCQDAPEIDNWLPLAVGDGAGDPLAKLMLGARTFQRGWAVRTGARATHVSQDQFKAFHEHLREAEEYFYAAADLDRESPAPWYYLLASARGVQAGLPIAQRRFDALVKRAPDHVAGYRQMLQTVCRKWSGSHELMHEFALEAARGPHGMRLGELVAFAHIEHWLDLPSGEDAAYIVSHPVRAELVEAAELSIFHAHYTPAPRSPYAAPNAFAMALSMSGLHAQARAAFALTEGVVLEQPWHYLKSNPLLAYAMRRDLSFQAR
ncbi:MAG: hypothetical protein ACRDTP_06190, partial [Mycobacteriales bacterium]